MQSGWECIKCHNIYSPNTPFCIYCWFQMQNNDQKNLNPNDQQKDINENLINEQKNKNKNLNLIKEEILVEESSEHTQLTIDRENMSIPPIDIKIPALDKLPTQPLANNLPDTKIFLAGIGSSKERAIARTFKIPYVLDSIMDFPKYPSILVRNYFDYIKSNTEDYLLDSGAYTYLHHQTKSINLSDHIKQYCYYINEFNIDKFFELDLDLRMSIEEIENIRKKIYLETHKKPIIVFHLDRGKEYWTNMCKENDYIAIGKSTKLDTKGMDWNFKSFIDMCDEAHSYGTLVHGLGFTPLEILNARAMCFDTVDSTSWNGGKYGTRTILTETGNLMKLKGPHPSSAMEGRENNLIAWAKFAMDYKGGPRENLKKVETII